MLPLPYSPPVAGPMLMGAGPPLACRPVRASWYAPRPAACTRLGRVLRLGPMLPPAAAAATAAAATSSGQVLRPAAATPKLPRCPAWLLLPLAPTLASAAAPAPQPAALSELLLPAPGDTACWLLLLMLLLLMPLLPPLPAARPSPPEPHLLPPAMTAGGLSPCCSRPCCCCWLLPEPCAPPEGPAASRHGAAVTVSPRLYCPGVPPHWGVRAKGDCGLLLLLRMGSVGPASTSILLGV